MNPSPLPRRKDTQALKPTLQVGKSGLTPGMANEITLQLKKKRVMKVKLLRSALGNQGREDLCRELEEKVPCRIIRVVGNVVTLSYSKPQVIKAGKQEGGRRGA